LGISSALVTFGHRSKMESGAMFIDGYEAIASFLGSRSCKNLTSGSGPAVTSRDASAGGSPAVCCFFFIFRWKESMTVGAAVSDQGLVDDRWHSEALGIDRLRVRDTTDRACRFRRVRHCNSHSWAWPGPNCMMPQISAVASSGERLNTPMCPLKWAAGINLGILGGRSFGAGDAGMAGFPLLQGAIV
jgi:hypothetical protein